MRAATLAAALLPGPLFAAPALRDAETLRFPSGQPTPRTEDSLADRIGERVRSRLYEMCRVVEITAPDYRQRVRQAQYR